MQLTTEQFNIRWNNYSSVLQSDIRKHLAQGQFVDVALACEGGKSIKCHRVILSACSTYFEKILKENPFPHLVIYLKDTKVWELQALITFMYNGEVSVNQQKLQGLVKAAEALKIKGLSPDNEEDVKPNQEDEDEEFDLRAVAGITPEGSPKKEESLLRIVKLEQNPQPPPLAPAAASRLQHLKRKVGMTSPPKLVKVQKTDGHGSRNHQVNGGNSLPPVLEREPQTSTSSSMSAPAKFRKVLDENDSVLREFERAEVEEMYGADLEAIEDGDGLKDVEELEESVEEDLNGNSNGGHSTGSDNEDGVTGAGAASGGRKLRYKYAKDIRDSALSALTSGVSLRQTSEAFGIPRKTLSKWKAQGIRGTAHLDDTCDIDEHTTTRRAPETGDRAERLQKAMELAMTGTTVRQAAAQYDIPRTTLCAYMKRQKARTFGGNGEGVLTHHPVYRRGVAAKRSFLRSGLGAPLPRRLAKRDSPGPSQSHSDDFPFLGISELIQEAVGNG